MRVCAQSSVTPHCNRDKTPLAEKCMSLLHCFSSESKDIVGMTLNIKCVTSFFSSMPKVGYHITIWLNWLPVEEFHFDGQALFVKFCDYSTIWKLMVAIQEDFYAVFLFL